MSWQSKRWLGASLMVLCLLVAACDGSSTSGRRPTPSGPAVNFYTDQEAEQFKDRLEGVSYPVGRLEFFRVMGIDLQRIDLVDSQIELRGDDYQDTHHDYQMSPKYRLRILTQYGEGLGPPPPMDKPVTGATIE